MPEKKKNGHPFILLLEKTTENSGINVTKKSRKTWVLNLKWVQNEQIKDKILDYLWFFPISTRDFEYISQAHAIH